jgi:nitroreductase
MERLNFIYKRKSVRKFLDQPVLRADLEEILKAATYAPSGKNLQNWHFVVIEGREMIEKISQVIENKVRLLAGKTKNEEISKAMIGGIPYYTGNLQTAPVVILAYASGYPSFGPELFAEGAIDEEEAKKLSRFAPGIQNVAAAFENMLLAAAALGYGTCWMTGPMYASDEISDCIGFHKEGFQLVTMTPLGVPAIDGATPPRKPLSEVVTFISK